MTLEELKARLDTLIERIEHHRSGSGSIGEGVNLLSQEIMQSLNTDRKSMSVAELAIFSQFESENLFDNFYDEFPILLKNKDGAFELHRLDFGKRDIT